MNSVLCFLFSVVYRRWLWNDWTGTYDKVLRVKGWRTAVITAVTKSGIQLQRRTMTPCFWIFQ